MSHPVPLFGHRPEPTPFHALRPVPSSLSPTAVGTTTPAPGPRGPGAGCPPAEPSKAELQAIEAEWPLIAAEVALVDAECAYAIRPSAANRAAVRAAEAAVIRAHLAHTRTTRTPSQGEAA